MALFPSAVERCDSVQLSLRFPLQCMSALFMGNQGLNKVDSKVMIVQEQFVRMLHEMGCLKRTWTSYIAMVLL